MTQSWKGRIGESQNLKHEWDATELQKDPQVVSGEKGKGKNQLSYYAYDY